MMCRYYNTKFSLKLRWFKVFYLVLIPIFLSGCGESPSQNSTRYSKAGFNLKLPGGWDVINDGALMNSIRNVLIVSDAGSILSVDIYDRLVKSPLPTPTMKEYFKRYISTTIPLGNSKDSASISYGSVDRRYGKALFAEIKVTHPEAIPLFVETVRYEDSSFIVYFTFQSELSEASSTSQVIDPFLENFSIQTLGI